MQIVLKQFTKIRNAGDLFARDIAERYIGAVEAVADEKELACPNLVLIGSILQWADQYSIVCGAGLKSRDSQVYRKPRHILAVRGPLTRQLLLQQGILCPETYGDPGILASEFVNCGSSNIKFKYGIVPHYVDRQNPVIEASQSKEVSVIDVGQQPQKMLSELRQCEIVLSSSLHGIVFAHAIGRPALWIELSDKVEGAGFKFYDYYFSLGLSPICVPINGAIPFAELGPLATFVDQEPLRPGLRNALRSARKLLNGT